MLTLLREQHPVGFQSVPAPSQSSTHLVRSDARRVALDLIADASDARDDGPDVSDASLRALTLDLVASAPSPRHAVAFLGASLGSELAFDRLIELLDGTVAEATEVFHWLETLRICSRRREMSRPAAVAVHALVRAAVSSYVMEIDADLGARAGELEPKELGLRLARILGPSAAPTTDSAWYLEALRTSLPALRRPHDLAKTPLAIAAGGASEARASVERACAALAREPAYAESARVLLATYFGPEQKQRAVASDLRLPFGTYRHHLRRAIALLAIQMNADASVAG